MKTSIMIWVIIPVLVMVIAVCLFHFINRCESVQKSSDLQTMKEMEYELLILKAQLDSLKKAQDDLFIKNGNDIVRWNKYDQSAVISIEIESVKTAAHLTALQTIHDKIVKVLE